MMLNPVERPTLDELRHAAEHAAGVLEVESIRARWLGHRLYAEMSVAVDPALSFTDARKVADNVKDHARGHLPELERLLVEIVAGSGGKRWEHHPQAEHQHHH